MEGVEMTICEMGMKWNEWMLNIVTIDRVEFFGGNEYWHFIIHI